MKQIKLLNITTILFSSILLSGCGIVSDIFKTGVGIGVFIAISIIIIILFFVIKLRKGKSSK